MVSVVVTLKESIETDLTWLLDSPQLSIDDVGNVNCPVQRIGRPAGWRDRRHCAGSTGG